MKLGAENIEKIKGTSLDRADEKDELVMLNRGAAHGELTSEVKQLIDDAVAGKDVSAIAYSATINVKSPTKRAQARIAAREAKALAEQDVGENSTSENARLRVEIERLQNEKRRLELKVIGLESENQDLKDQIARLEKAIASTSAKPPEMPATLPPAPLEPLAPGDPGPVPDFLLRRKQLH
jgi:hypothetical protein